jgi:hypothetical protein
LNSFQRFGMRCSVIGGQPPNPRDLLRHCSGVQCVLLQRSAT